MPDFLPSSTTGYGTQQSPLDSFVSASGATGNKTTNKDLPQWLRDLGMKGDAYAGGMLKPELRYGFKYQGGKIHFADGTSYAAKKGKDGSYSYTGADGTPQTYSPTDDQNAYNKKYQASTSNQSFLDKATNAVKFELDHGQQILKGIGKHPQQILFGIDPIGTKIGNAVTGDNATAQVDQLGGALDSRYADYENRTGKSTGYAKDLQGVAHVIASAYGAKGLGKLAGAGAKSLAATEGGGGTLGQAASAGAKLVASNPKLLAGAVRAGNAALSAGAGAPITPAGTLSTVASTGAGTDVLAPSSFSRERAPVPTNMTRYGMGPEQSFYRPVDSAAVPVGIAPPPRVGLARGGTLDSVRQYPLRQKRSPDPTLRNFSKLPGMEDDPRVRIALGDPKPKRNMLVHRAEGGALTQSSPYVAHGTGESGRADNIDAKLSENEYVIDAETVALLGDGNPEAGAKKLDAMRQNIRKHKGRALASGKISPDAKGGALQYLARGGKVKSLQKAMGEFQAVLAQGVSRSTGFDARDRIAAKHGVSPTRLDQALMDLHHDVYPASDDEVEEAIREKINAPVPPRKVIKKAGGGSVRPRQSITAALDAQDTDFDEWRSRQKPFKTTPDTVDYEKRARVRVGDTTHDLGKMPHWLAKTLGKGDKPRQVARLAEGGKVGVLGKMLRQFRGPPRPDPTVHLQKMKDMLDEALVRTPVVPPRRATNEELEQDVQTLRREQSRGLK